MPDAQHSAGGPPAVRSSAIAERAEQTRAALIAAARRLFVEKGYYATGTEEIVTAADVGTRGALYHHFADKQALFLAVIEALEQDLLDKAAATTGTGTAFDQLRTGLLGFLDASLTPEVQRILLIDGPAVLGWQQWRALEQHYGLGAIHTLLELAINDGSLPAQPLDALAHLLLATIDEAALFIANADNPSTARDDAVQTVNRLLAGLSTTTAGKDSSRARPRGHHTPK
jgi:AcrR family transcriptional regulator